MLKNQLRKLLLHFCTFFRCSDQILVDNSGVAKMSGLTRSIVLHPNDRDRFLDPLSSTKLKGQKSVGTTEEEIVSNPYVAPELSLGPNCYTQ